MEAARVLIALSGIIVVGYSLLSIIFYGMPKGLPWAERIALSYGLGIGFFSLEMLIFFIMGKAFSIAALAAPGLVVIVTVSIALIVNNRFRRTRDEGRGMFVDSTPQTSIVHHPIIHRDARSLTNRTHLKTFLISAIAIIIIYTGFRTMVKPIESYDAVGIHSLKSKIFFINRSIPPDFFTGIGRSAIPHPDYPLNIPLIETFLYVCIGSLNDQLVKVIFFLYFISILTILYYAIRRFADYNYALLFTFLLASISQFNSFATNAYLEVPLAYYCFASALYLILWIEDRSRTSCLILSALMSGLAAWTKNEGLLYCVVYTAIVSAYLAAKRRQTGAAKIFLLPAAYLMIIALISAPWFLVKWRYGLTNSDVSMPSSPVIFVLFKNLWKMGPMAYDFQKQIFGPKKWNIIWILALATFALKSKRAFGPVMKYITISILAVIAGYFAVYAVSRIDIRFLLRTTWSRFILHFLPLVVYWLARMWREDMNS
ncbi:MAG: hypothetical protein Q8N91_00515 [Candidatus Omnitrophota bacterium]|nr:hypothetical protein [Candidatus Omnitrophota bacterium]